MLVRDFLYRVSTTLHDDKPQFKRWSERELVSWTNDGQRALAKYLPQAGARTDALRLVPGTLQRIDKVPAARLIDRDGATPGAEVKGVMLFDLVCNLGADGATRGASITAVDRGALDRSNRMWHGQAVAASIDHFTYDPRNPLVFYVSPPVHGTTPVWAEMAWSAQPAELPAAGDKGSEVYLADGLNDAELSIDDLYADDLVHYVCARAYMKDSEDGDTGNASAHAQTFLASLNAQVAAVTGNNPNLQTLPFAPAPIGQAR